MKQSRFSEELEQSQDLLEADTTGPIAEVAKKHGVSSQTIYGWRKTLRDLWRPGDAEVAAPA